MKVYWRLTVFIVLSFLLLFFFVFAFFLNLLPSFLKYSFSTVMGFLFFLSSLEIIFYWTLVSIVVLRSMLSVQLLVFVCLFLFFVGNLSFLSG